MRNLVVWLSFAWSFGIFVFGHLWRFHSVICDLQIIVCCLKPPIMSQILRKQCVNILFQLGVFYNIQRKSHFYKTLIFRTLSEQRNIMEYHFAILIIWRSQVQALAGPRLIIPHLITCWIQIPIACLCVVFHPLTEGVSSSHVSTEKGNIPVRSLFLKTNLTSL